MFDYMESAFSTKKNLFRKFQTSSNCNVFIQLMAFDFPKGNVGSPIIKNKGIIKPDKKKVLANVLCKTT